MKNHIDHIDSEILYKDFIENVLIHLLPNASINNVLSSIYGTMNLKNETIFDFGFDYSTLIKCEPKFVSNSNSFIHFTSLKALHSILNENSIRLYDLKNSNDPNEFTFSALKFGYNRSNLDFQKENIYTFSMCETDTLESDNILTLWRYYGQEGSGCVIEFEISYNNVDSNKRLTKFPLAKIQYSEQNNYRKFFDANKEFENKHNVKTDLTGSAKILSLLYKLPIYKNEEEVRLFCQLENDKHEKFDQNIAKFDFSPKGEIVSFVSIPLYKELNDFKTPSIKIKRIQLGFKLSESKLNEYKKHLKLMFISLRKKLNKDIEVPIIEQSPLVGFYE